MTLKIDKQKPKKAIERNVEYGDGLHPPYGVIPDAEIKCPGNKSEGQWQTRFDWLHAGTRYDVLYCCRLVEPCNEDDGKRFVLIHMNGFGRKYATAFEFTSNSFTHYTYLMEKMDVNIADAMGLLSFLQRMGHRVGFPKPDEVCGSMERQKWRDENWK